jgi:hypothetical protein
MPTKFFLSGFVKRPFPSAILAGVGALSPVEVPYVPSSGQSAERRVPVPHTPISADRQTGVVRGVVPTVGIGCHRVLNSLL